jgi:chaperonin GroES
MAKTAKSTQTIQPLFGNVLIKPLEAETKTSGGIYLPDTAKEKPQVGEIMAVGDGSWNEDADKKIPMEVKVGQKVMYKKWGGNEVKVGNEEWTILDQKDILAIVN